MKPLLLIVGGLLLTAVGLLLALPSIVYASEGKFRWCEQASELSPDGRFRVVVSKRVAFPAFDFIDPSIVVRGELRDNESRQVLASDQVVLMEDSDFSTPEIRWVSGESRVTRFDRRRKQTMTLKARTNHSFQAAPGTALLSALRPWPGLPEPVR